MVQQNDKEFFPFHYSIFSFPFTLLIESLGELVFPLFQSKNNTNRENTYPTPTGSIFYLQVDHTMRRRFGIQRCTSGQVLREDIEPTHLGLFD